MIKLTPPMGWNSWNTFGENINEKMIFETADVMAESGLRDKGYEYLVIDDCWSLRERDENGRLVPDPEKFPHGMKAVADYVHSKGLKFGMYSCAGNMTCAGYPGSYEHEFVDAETFASWDVDTTTATTARSCTENICTAAWDWHSRTAAATFSSLPAPGVLMKRMSGSKKPALPCGVPPATSLIPGILSKISWHSRKNCIRTTASAASTIWTC